jgi:hypothetical protein
MLTSKLTDREENKAIKAKFRIVVNQGSECSTVGFDVYYTVQIQKSFLGFKYWCTLEHTSLHEDCPLREETKFETIQEAREFISNLRKIEVIPI